VKRVLLKDRPYCRDCYQKKRFEIIEISTTVGADITRDAQKAGLSESQVVEIRDELQAQLQGALQRLDELCLRKDR